MPNARTTLPLSAAPIEASPASPHPFAAVSSFLHHRLSRLGAELSARMDEGWRLLARSAAARPRPPSFAAVSAPQEAWGGSPALPAGRHVFDVALSAEHVARTLAGTPVYTVSNSSNEFVLVSDPKNGLKSLGLLCFRHEDAQALLAQVQLRQPILGKGARVVPITLDQVYMLKVEGIAFRFLPDPLQIKNAMELKPADRSRGFDGVPVFQSDLLVVKKKNKRYCPIYFQKEDIERELLKVSKASRGSGFSQNILVGSLEDVLKKMETNEKDSGWEDLIFVPPGKSYTQHINEVAA